MTTEALKKRIKRAEHFLKTLRNDMIKNDLVDWLRSNKKRIDLPVSGVSSIQTLIQLCQDINKEACHDN